MLAQWLKNHLRTVWWVLFFLCAIPAIDLLRHYSDGTLGANPLETLLHVTGRCSLILMAVTLSITPIRKWLATLSRLTARR